MKQKVRRFFADLGSLIARLSQLDKKPPLPKGGYVFTNTKDTPKRYNKISVKVDDSEKVINKRYNHTVEFGGLYLQADPEKSNAQRPIDYERILEEIDAGISLAIEKEDYEAASIMQSVRDLTIKRMKDNEA